MSSLDQMPVEPALVERFRRDVARVWPPPSSVRPEPVEGPLSAPTALSDGGGASTGSARTGRGCLALAVSGGPDSMALLALAATAFPGDVIAATVDHRLRLAAAEEAAMVSAWCARHAIPHTTLVVEDAIGTSSVQAQARERRYALLIQWAAQAGAACLATAHHADDQAETFLMRAARGSGVAGLGGIRARQRGAAIDVIRPLLDWRVAELRALVTTRAIPFVDDPSNADPHYDRTRFRALLRETPWLDPAQLARSAAYAAEADATLREIEAWLWQTRTVQLQDKADAPTPFALSLSKGTVPQEPRTLLESGASTGSARTGEGESAPASRLQVDVTDLPRELKRRLARKALHTVRTAHAVTTPAFTDSANIEPLLDSLEAGKTATHAGIVVSVHDKHWHFALQPPRRPL